MGPLEGVRVVEFAGLGPAPVCGMLLADLGADVVLVERASANPNAAALLSGADGDPAAIHNRGKRSIAVDLKSSDGVAVVLDLVARADLLIEGFRPGVMERLGLGPDACLACNPALVYGRMTGWGQHGPLAQAAGHDINYVALSGALHHAGSADTPPLPPPTLVGDIGGGTMLLAVGLLAALHRARASGQGQVVDAAITDGSALLTTLLHSMRAFGQWSDRRQDNLLDGGAPWYGTYACADGRFVTVGALEPAFHRDLLERLGLPDDDPLFTSQFDKAAWPAQRQRLATLFKTRTRDAWCELLEGTDACFAPVLDLAEAPGHPHNAERATFVERDGVTQPAPAPRFGATPAAIGGSPPRRGEHGSMLLRELGYDDDRIDDLQLRGVLVSAGKAS